LGFVADLDGIILSVVFDEVHLLVFDFGLRALSEIELLDSVDPVITIRGHD